MEYFDPQTNRYPYPLDTDKHYLSVKKNDGTVFDKNYPYVDTSKGMKRKMWWARLLLNILVFPLTYIRLGLKVEGRENLNKYKDVINKGVISVCNHVHMWDYLAIMAGIRPIKTHILAWAPNVRGENGKMMRAVGAIPVPEDDMEATFTYLKEIGKMLDKGGWLHIYAEGSMWEYYAPIRPFKRGAAYLACENDKPIIPLAFSYRKPTWFRRVIMKQLGRYTLHIGEPIYPDKTLSRTQQEIDLTIRAHKAVVALAGRDPEHELYRDVFNHDKRVDYYTDTYGVNYKGSW